MRVVDALEVVEVEDRHRERRAVALLARPLFGEARLEVAARREARELVGDGDPPVAGAVERRRERREERADLRLGAVVDRGGALEDRGGRRAGRRKRGGAAAASWRGRRRAGRAARRRARSPSRSDPSRGARPRAGRARDWTCRAGEGGVPVPPRASTLPRRGRRRRSCRGRTARSRAAPRPPRRLAAGSSRGPVTRRGDASRAPARRGDPRGARRVARSRSATAAERSGRGRRGGFRPRAEARATSVRPKREKAPDRGPRIAKSVPRATSSSGDRGLGRRRRGLGRVVVVAVALSSSRARRRRAGLLNDRRGLCRRGRFGRGLLPPSCSPSEGRAEHGREAQGPELLHKPHLLLSSPRFCGAKRIPREKTSAE